MTVACSCSNTLNNTGTPNCQPLMKVAKKFIIVPTYTSAGVRNKMLISTAISQAAYTALINQADKTLRYYPSPTIEAIGGERGEPVFDTAPSGKKSFIREGVRNMTCQFWDQGAEYLYQLKAMRCTEISVYIVDAEGNLIGMRPTTADGYIYPIKVDKASWNAALLMPTDSVSGKIALTFDWDSTESDEYLIMIGGTEIAADLLGSEGLMDIEVVYGAGTTTTQIITLQERFGSAKTKNKLTGLVVTDFISSTTATTSKIRNITDSADITLSSVVEDTAAPGTYTLTFTPAQTSADVMAIKVLKSGFDFADTVANTFAIP